tara:strand:- start:41871 stop:45248 length:3378 start_codon:yes stop_codon:yes gene_type:complete
MVPGVESLEDYLLECIDRLQRAGDDEGRRKRELQRPKAWSLLSIEWKALAMLAATNASPKSIEKSEKNNRSHRARIGRRGGRGANFSLEDRIEHPQNVIDNPKSSAPYRLAVLIAQKSRMEQSWNEDWDETLTLLREECEDGIHPVWERMAREAPIIAELGRFPSINSNRLEEGSLEWFEFTKFDPQNSSALLEWLESCPLKLDQHQAHSLQRIVRDLRSGKPRPKQWKKWMNPSLTNMKEDFAMLEGMLLSATSDKKAADVFSNIAKGKTKLAKIGKAQLDLITLREDNVSNWSELITIEDTNPLSQTILFEAWLRYQTNNNLEIDELVSGYELLINAGINVKQELLWDLISGLLEFEDLTNIGRYTSNIVIENSDQMSLAINVVKKNNDKNLLEKILNTLEKSNPDIVLEAMQDKKNPLLIRKRAARILSQKNYHEIDEILDIFTQSSDIEGLKRYLLADNSISTKYPQRALLVWHLVPASNAIDDIDSLDEIRRLAINSLTDSKLDSAMTEASISLIALMSGVPSSMDAVHEKLDSDGVLALNEVRRALSVDGDGVVKEAKIETLKQSVSDAELTLLENDLFSALVTSLLLNRATMDLNLKRNDRALESLRILCSEPNVTMSTIRNTSDLVLEHEIAIPELELWYRVNQNGSAEHQIVRAMLSISKDDRINAARAYRDAAMKAKHDFEKSSLLLRKSLIEFAHAGGWKEAVNLIDLHSELTASITSRFQLYLRTCADADAGKNEIATQRIIEYITEREPGESPVGKIDQDAIKRRIEMLDRAMSYAADHRLPEEPFRGRVRAARMMLRKSESSRRNELEGRFLLEMEKRDVLEITLIAEEVAEISPIRGLRMFEIAIDSDNFNPNQIKALIRSQKAMFRRHNNTIPIKQRRALRNISLKPLVVIDTNILIDALKDDLLSQISQDSIGVFDWSIERTFVWTLKRRCEEGLVQLHIPEITKAEFLNRAKSPDVALSLFDDVYINHEIWNNTITDGLLKERVLKILKTFDNSSLKNPIGEGGKLMIHSFLIRHKDIFSKITEAKMLARDNIPERTSLDGNEIYPENGDIELMNDCYIHANSTIPDIGSVLVASRDSDFMLISRALQDSFGFGVISNAQQLNSKVL